MCGGSAAPPECTLRLKEVKYSPSGRHSFAKRLNSGSSCDNPIPVIAVRSRSAQSSNLSGSNPKAVSFNFCGARAHRDLFGHPRWWAEGPELVYNLLLLQPALPHPRNKTISYPLHILGVPL